jgi:hypothetical protein
MRAAVLPVYYGGFVLAGSAVSEMLVMGATAYASGLFLRQHLATPLSGAFDFR